MKIICIESNYPSQENKNSEPVFFLKPETAIIRNKLPFFIPEHASQIIPRINIVLKVCRLGKNIQERFANRYYTEIGIGVDMEAADVLETCRNKGLPWEKAKAYDSSAPLGDFISINEVADHRAISFSLFKNGDCILKANTYEMIYSFDKIISHVSKFMTLKMGDHIFTGSPETEQSIDINDKIDCFLEDKKLLSFKIK
jgi:acylpyruvate hydrolase